MNLRSLLIAVTVVFAAMLAPLAMCQNIYGSTQVDIDPVSNVVAATCETYSDYGVQSYYDVNVHCLLYTPADFVNYYYLYYEETEMTDGADAVVWVDVPADPNVDSYAAISTHSVNVYFFDYDYWGWYDAGGFSWYTENNPCPWYSTNPFCSPFFRYAVYVSVQTIALGHTIIDQVRVSDAVTKEVWMGGQLLGKCAATLACYNTATPMCFSPSVDVGENGTCAAAWRIGYLTYRIGSSGPWHCFPIGVALQMIDTSAEFCTPAH